MNVRDEWVLVTGAASGIGAAIATELASRGARLWLTDIDVDALGRLASRLRAEGATVCSRGLDVRDREAWHELAEDLEARGEVPVVLVNNAGVAALGPALDLPLASWQRVIDTNLWGVIHGCRALVPKMIAAPGRRAVLNVASASAYVGLPFSAPYFIAKAGVLRLSQTLQAEVDPRQVSFTTLCPAQVETGLADSGVRLGSDLGAAGQRLDAWLRPSGRDPARVARRAVRGTLSGRATVNVYAESWLLEAMMRFLPHQLLAWVNRAHFVWRFPEHA